MIDSHYAEDVDFFSKEIEGTKKALEMEVDSDINH
jgi:hypothetical protein